MFTPPELKLGPTSSGCCCVGRISFCGKAAPVLAGVVAAADGDDDELPAVDTVGHRRSALRCGHPDLADLRPGLLVEARSIAPRGRLPGFPRTCGSPITTSVLVTIRPTPDVPAWLVFGMFRPLSAGCVRMLSGVSPCDLPENLAAIQVDRREHAAWRFTIGRPWTVSSCRAAMPALARSDRVWRRGRCRRGRQIVARLASAVGRAQSPGPEDLLKRPSADAGHVADIREALRRLDERARRLTLPLARDDVVRGITGNAIQLVAVLGPMPRGSGC